MDAFGIQPPNRPQPRPEWVGVAVRYPDGQVVTYEFTEISRDVTVECDYGDIPVRAFGQEDPARCLGSPWMALRVEGKAVHVNYEWATPPRRDPAAEIPSAQQRALEAVEPGE